MTRLLLIPALLVTTPVWAAASSQEIEVSAYKPLKVMGRVAAEARQDMDAALLSISVRNHKLKQAQGQMDHAAQIYGEGSNDHALAVARYQQVRRETLKIVLEQLENAAPRLEAAEQASLVQVQKMVGSKGNFQELVKGHLKGERTPATTGLILYMAISKLHQRCQQLYGQALIDQLDADLSDIEDTLAMLGDMIGPNGSGGGTSLDEAWEMFQEQSLSADGGELDELDALLGG